MPRTGEGIIEQALRLTLCKTFGHANVSHHSIVVTPPILETMDDMLAQANKDTTIKLQFSGKCTFCDTEMWVMWPSVEMYLKSKGIEQE